MGEAGKMDFTVEGKEGKCGRKFRRYYLLTTYISCAVVFLIRS
jgi:hypothetical protein